MIHDVAIIGAGPCGLAVAARLREPSPSALFTDIEHARFWNRRHNKNTINNESKPHSPGKRGTVANERPKYSVVVFDAHSDAWMSSWRAKFKALGIEYLRSPLFFHPDPRDRDGLLGFAHARGRMGELVEIRGVVGREVSKHGMKKGRGGRGSNRQSTRHLRLDGRDRNDYFTPSSRLFDAYVDSVVDRYRLVEILCQAEIVGLSYDELSYSGTGLFTLTSSTGEKYRARTVVLATGPVNIPTSCSLLLAPNEAGSAAHVFDPSQPLLPPQVLAKLKSKAPTTIVIVGGGLTSAQVADLLLSRYSISSVHLVLRSRLKVKHFDIDLPWVTKLRNREMAAFWSADTDEERFEMLKAAKGGGSISPGYEKILRNWEKRGRLYIHREYEISVEDGLTSWDSEKQMWSLNLRSTKPQPECSKLFAYSEFHSIRTIQNVDHVIFATSTPPHVDNVQFMRLFKQNHPIQNIKGLPVLTENLMWNSKVPLFLTGALAGLRLGPGAGNLAGARLGAERIAWAIEEVLPRASQEDQESAFEQQPWDFRRDSGYASEDVEVIDSKANSVRGALWDHYNKGLGNQFEGLSLLDN